MMASMELSDSRVEIRGVRNDAYGFQKATITRTEMGATGGLSASVTGNSTGGQAASGTRQTTNHEVLVVNIA